jgi:hypothetical protein
MPTIGFQELIILTIPFVFGFLTMSVSKSRSNTPILWFFLGVFLGPIGLFDSFFVSQKKTCLKCRQLIDSRASKCCFCTADQ